MAESTPPTAEGPCPEEEVVWRPPPTHIVLAAGLAGALAGMAVIVFGYWGWPEESRRLMRTGPFVLWTFLIALNLLLWSLAIVPVTRIVRARRDALPRAWAEVIFSSLIFVAFFAAVGLVFNRLVALPPYIPHLAWRVGVIIVAGGSVGLVAGWGLWLTRNAALELVHSTLSVAERRTRFRDYRQGVERLLGILAAVIALAVLVTAAQRQLVIEFTDSLEHDEIAGYANYLPFEYPAEFVIVYGLMFTIFLALAALPTLATLQTVGRKLLDVDEPSPQQRQELAARYSLEVSPAQVLKTTLAILAPLLGSVASLLLPEIT